MKDKELLIETLYDMWARRNPQFETHYEYSVLRILTDYGVGSSDLMASKGKVLGAGYEAYILAYFIGLYSGEHGEKKILSGDVKKLGQPIQFWGNLDSKKGRTGYQRLRQYIFISLIARTEVDWIEVDKGNIPVNEAVSAMIDTMEQYANYGFSLIEQKLEEDSSFFASNMSFLNIFLRLTHIIDKDKEEKEEEDYIVPEPLD